MIDLETIRSALSNLLANAVSFVPRLLTAIIILIVGRVIGKLLGALFQRVAKRVGLDKAVEGTGLAEGLAQARITQTPSELLGLFIYWLIFLNFLLIALENLGLTAAVEQLQLFIGYLPRLLSALLALVAGALLAQFIGRITQAAVASMGVEFHEALGQAVRGLLLVITFIIAIGQLGLDVTVLTDSFTNLLAIIAAGLALAFGLGGREVARNVLAGHYAREVYALGDRVIIDNQEGTLDAIGTLNAEILVGQERLVVPNTRLTEYQVRIRNIDHTDFPK